MTSLDSSRSAARASAALICVLLAAGYAHARIHRSQSWAETQFAKAESLRQTLTAEPEQARTRREYENAIDSYRRIVLESPTSSKADASAFTVAELTAQMGRRFKDDIALYSAVREYKFLRREYPGSKHRIEALLAIGEIYQNDLADDADGRAALEELVQRYPHSESSERARADLNSADPPKLVAADTETSRPAGFKQAANAANTNGALAAATRLASDGDLVRVTSVEHWSAPDYTRVVVELEQDVEFESQRIDHPDRIFFDLKNARLSSDLIGKSFDVDDGLVRKVRVAQFKPGKARIVIETIEHANYNASLVLNPPRLVIDVHTDDVHGADIHRDARVEDVRSRDLHADESTTAPRIKPANATTENSVVAKVIPAAEKPSIATAAVPKKVVVEADDEDSTDDAATLPAQKSSATLTKSVIPERTKKRVITVRSTGEAQPTSSGDRSLIRTLGLKIGKIVIDPGHGGHDTGTIGPNGLLEKDLVLDVSKRLGKLLQARLGSEVVFTRRDDTFIPLEARTAIANQEQADLFVSVHANSSHDRDARGVETYYLNFTSSPEALEVAARENAASDKDIHELQDLVRKIALKEKIEESREFASDVQQSLHSGLAAKSSGIRDRGVKKAPFVVLIGANMPSILAEISFISNPGDEKRLQSSEYRQRIAESLYRGISRYVNGLGGIKVATKMEKTSAD